MSELVKRLRIAARHDHSQGAMMRDAADLIENLQEHNSTITYLAFMAGAEWASPNVDDWYLENAAKQYSEKTSE